MYIRPQNDRLKRLIANRAHEGDAREPAPPRGLGPRDPAAEAGPVRAADGAAVGPAPGPHVPLPARGAQLSSSEVCVCMHARART